MVLSNMAFPINVPWEQIGVTQDMMDKSLDIDVPAKWKSSISVFKYEPDEISEIYKDRKITYLKVACTITNYGISNDEDISAFHSIEGTWLDVFHPEDNPIRNPLAKTYPCYGALVQVSVFPNPLSNVPIYEFPHIMSFEPTKRELYEVLSESGEAVSQSSNTVNVGKTLTSQDSTESTGHTEPSYEREHIVYKPPVPLEEWEKLGPNPSPSEKLRLVEKWIDENWIDRYVAIPVKLEPTEKTQILDEGSLFQLKSLMEDV